MDEPPDLDAVPDDLRPVLEPCLAKDPAARPTAAELAAHLADRRGPGSHWPPTGRDRLLRQVPAGPDPADRRVFTRRRVLGATIVGAVGVAAALVVRSGAVTPPPAPVRGGTIRWSAVLPDAEPIWHLVHGAGTVIADTQSQLHGLDAGTGALRWSSPILGSHTGDLATTLCAGDAVFSNNERGIFALDAATGRLRWERDGSELLHAGEALVLGRVPVVPVPVVGSGDSAPSAPPDLPARDPGELLGIDPATGATRWRYPYPAEEESDTGVVVTPGRLHVAFRTGLTTFDPVSGAVLWSVPWPVRYAPTGLAVHGDAVLLATAGELVSLDAASGAQRWAHPVRNNSAGLPFVHGGSVYFTTLSSLSVYDAGTGRPLWDVEPPGEFATALAGRGDAVYIVAEPADTATRAIEVRSYGVAAGDLRWTVRLDRATGLLGLRNFTALDDAICLSIDVYAPRPSVYAFDP